MKEIFTIEGYPDNGKHQECDIGIYCFEIRKGEDGYVYYSKKGEEKEYNIFKNENIVDKRWIVNLRGDSNESLEEIFETKVNKDLDKIIEYCIKIYKKSLLMEIKRLKEEYEKH